MVATIPVLSKPAMPDAGRQRTSQPNQSIANQPRPLAFRKTPGSTTDIICAKYLTQAKYPSNLHFNPHYTLLHLKTTASVLHSEKHYQK